MFGYTPLLERVSATQLREFQKGLLSAVADLMTFGSMMVPKVFFYVSWSTYTAHRRV
jgi:hypothetical protein